MNLATFFARFRDIMGMICNAGQLPVIIESEDGTETFTPLSIRVDSKAGVFISIQTKGKEAARRYGNESQAGTAAG